MSGPFSFVEVKKAMGSKKYHAQSKIKDSLSRKEISWNKKKQKEIRDDFMPGGQDESYDYHR